MKTDISNQLKIKVIKEASLSNFTTFRLGGHCKAMFLCQTSTELIECINFLNENNEDFFLIGEGSNVVVSDQGLKCFVIRYLSETPIIKQKGLIVTVSGSTRLDDLAQFTVNHALKGLAYTSGIPGTVGGAIVGNAGAYGQQVGDVLKSITVITKSGIKKKILGEELDFSYRYSNLRHSTDIILEAQFLLESADQHQLKQERQKILTERKLKHPDLKLDPCAGSFFRNVEPTSKAGQRQAAGWFLEQAGGKSLHHGGAKIFNKHANIIIKSDQCSAQDVFELSKKMKSLVREKFKFDLIQEVRFVGVFVGRAED